MTDDLDTLLRGAAREPTIDLDVDDVHSRGRRRTIARRVAAGVGVLAVAGAVAVGISTLAPEPTPFVDDAPPSEPAPGEPSPSDGASPDEQASEDAGPGPDHFTHEVAMADLGVTVIDVVRSEDGAGGLHVRVVTSDGVIDESSTLAGSLPPAWSPVVVDHDLRVWANDADPNLLRGDLDAPLGSVVARAEDGVGWGLLGSAADGRPLVTRAVGAEGQLDEDAGDVLVWGEEGPEEISGITGRPTLTEATPVAAAAVAEHLAVLSVVGETSLVDLHPAGADPVAIAETGGVDRWFTDLAIVGDEVWVSERRQEGTTDLWLVSMDGSSVRRVPTPLGRDGGDREVVDLAAVEGPDGPVVAMSTRGEDGTARAYAVDVEAARAAAVEGEVPADASAPDDVFRLLDAQGMVHLLPPGVGGSEAGAELAECATEADGAYVNPRPLQEQTVLYYLCWDAMAQLPEGVAHPFGPSYRVAGTVGTTDADGLLQLLQTWASGPTAREAEAGLTGGLDPDVAMIADVTIDGTAVSVDLAAGDQVGVLGTTTGGATFVQAAVGVVLQYEHFETVRFTLNGSCEDFDALADAEAEACSIYDASDAPWAQAGGADA